MSYLRDLLKETKVLKVEKKLTGIEKTASTWGQPVKSRYIVSPFEQHLPVESPDPDQVDWDAYRKRMADCTTVRLQEDARQR